MGSDDFWHVHELAPEIREAAQEAARRRGLSLAQWLESVIARDQSGSPERSEAAPAGADRPSSQLEARLEELNRQVERLSRVGADVAGGEASQPEPQVPRSAMSESATSEPGDGTDPRVLEERVAALSATIPLGPPTKPLLDVLTKLSNRLDRLTAKPAAPAQAAPASAAAPAAPPNEPAAAPGDAGKLTGDWASDLDRAVAEITARQRALLATAEPQPAAASPADPARAPSIEAAAADSASAAGSAASPALAAAGESAPPPPSSGLAGLQERLDRLTAELRILREPGGFADTIDALRNELAAITHTLAEAAPRHVLQELQAEVQALVARFDERRQQGVDAAALAGVESSLARLCEAVEAMAPAENLATFRDEARALDRKIEQASAGGLVDASALPQLQKAVAELREIASRAATGEALALLAEEVQALGERLDAAASPSGISDALLASLDERFQALSADINARGAAGPAADDLVTVIDALSGKIDALEIGRENLPTMEAIVAQLTRLAERVEASGARLDQLDHIERSFTALLDRMDALRADAVSAAERAAREVLARHEDGFGAAGADMEAVRQHLDILARNQQQSDQRTQDTLEAVHDTLERLVDRLAGIEAGLRDEPLRAAASSGGSAAPMRSRAAVAAPSIAPTEPPADARPRPAPPPVSSERRPIDPTLPADYPLEPGAARARGALSSAAERIAASEAALGGVKPQSSADAKANFIAAARRAAQAAASMSAAPESAPEPQKSEPSVLSSLTQRITRRRPLLLIGVALCIGAGTASLLANGGLRMPTRAEIAALWPSAKPAKRNTQVAAKEEPPPPPAAPEKIASEASPPAPPAPPSTSPAAEIAPAQSPPASSPASPPVEAAAAAPKTPAATEPATKTEAAKPAIATVSPLTIASIQLPTADVTGALGRATGLGHAGGKAAPLAYANVTPNVGTGVAALPPRLRQAAANGDPAAEYEIATRFLEGRGVHPDLQEAARWFERAAARNFAPAQYRLASMYEKGHGVKKDLDQARRLYRAAADAGNGKATHNLAVLYAEGINGKPDYGLAAHWFRKAAELGIADSQYNLAVLYARGLGVEQNLAESYKWFALAARQGDKEAAKKRDEVATRLDQNAIVAARLAVQTFTPEPQPEEAVTVKAPPGGWDGPAEAGERPRAKNAGRKTGS